MSFLPRYAAVLALCFVVPMLSVALAEEDAKPKQAKKLPPLPPTIEEILNAKHLYADFGISMLAFLAKVSGDENLYACVYQSYLDNPFVQRRTILDLMKRKHLSFPYGLELVFRKDICPRFKRDEITFSDEDLKAIWAKAGRCARHGELGLCPWQAHRRLHTAHHR